MMVRFKYLVWCLHVFAVVLWKTKTLGFPGPCSGFPFSPPVNFEGVENGVFSFSGILSVLPEIYGICLLKVDLASPQT